MDMVTMIYMLLGGMILFFLLFCIETILIIIIARKTHAILEFKAWFKRIPLSLFFDDSGTVDWKVVKPEAGTIESKEYGTFVLNNKGRYFDKTTGNIILPFDVSVATNVNIRAAKVADDLQYVLNDANQFIQLRQAITMGQIKDSDVIDAIRTNVPMHSLRPMMNAILPHNITSKIEKILAQRMKGYGKVNHMQIILIFVAIFGAILLGYLIIKMTVGGNGGGATQVVQSAVQAAPSVVSVPPGTVPG